MKWTKFPSDWFSFWRKATKTPFAYTHVNGQCAFVAHVYHEFLNTGQERYGFFLGEVTNPFWAKHRSGLIRHGWVETWRKIVDPTRWCFMQNMRPMLAISSASSDDYDVGMNKFRAAFRRPMPEFNAQLPLQCDCQEIVNLFGGRVCEERLFWLSNLPTKDPIFADEAQRIRMFRWIQSGQFRAFIPIDNRV